MKLNFSILWFDDDDEYFDSLDLEQLEKDILSWGFSPVIDTVSTAEDFMTRSPFEIYDLIVVDRNLEGYEDGQIFIANIRGNAIYTVGNTSDLWAGIREKELEGVFVSSRTNILSKITKVGYQSIRKILDLENMRGIVMAEVGELDHLLDEILECGFGHLEEDQRQKIFKRFYEEANNQNSKMAQQLATFNENPNTISMLKLCDSNKRWENFNRLWKRHTKLRGRKKIGNYLVDILQPRNFLAHGKPEIDENGGYIFRHQEKEYIFNNQVSIILRQTILKYKETFEEIINLVKNE